MDCPRCGQTLMENESVCWQCGFDYKSGSVLKEGVYGRDVIDVPAGGGGSGVSVRLGRVALIAVVLLVAVGLLLSIVWAFVNYGGVVKGWVTGGENGPVFSSKAGALTPRVSTTLTPRVSTTLTPKVSTTLTSKVSTTLDIQRSVLVPKGVSSQYLTFDGERVRLDVYNPGLERCPAVILIHGAAGIEGDRAERYKGFATDLMNRGVLAINVHYFDSKRSKWLQTIISTISYAETIENVDKSRIGLVGYSLGGTLALQAASADDRVSLLVTNAGYLPSGFGWSDAGRLPPTFMVSGDQDSAVNDLIKVRDWCGEAGIPFKARIDKGIGHDNVPMNVFEEEWGDIVSFVIDNFQAKPLDGNGSA